MNHSAFHQVIKEAQVRLGWSIIGFLFSFCIGYAYSEELIFVFALPIKTTGIGAEFLCTQMTEAFQTYLKAGFLFSLYVNIPFFIYQIWCFLIPSYTEQQRRVTTQCLILSASLFFGGFIFAYCFAVPAIWTFFIKQCSSSISLLHFEFQPKVYDYVLLLFRIMLFFGICSQVPFFFVWLIRQKAKKTRQQFMGLASQAKRGAIDDGTLMGLAPHISFVPYFVPPAKSLSPEGIGFLPQEHFFFYRKKIFFASICVAALFSPPDLWSQLILLLPTYLFIEIGIFYEVLLGEYNLVGQSAGL